MHPAVPLPKEGFRPVSVSRPLIWTIIGLALSATGLLGVFMTFTRCFERVITQNGPLCVPVLIVLRSVRPYYYDNKIKMIHCYTTLAL